MSIQNYTIHAGNTYWLAYNGSDLYNYDNASPGNIVSTSQTYFETFQTYEELIQRILSLGGVIPNEAYPSEV